MIVKMDVEQSAKVGDHIFLCFDSDQIYMFDSLSKINLRSNIL